METTKTLFISLELTKDSPFQTTNEVETLEAAYEGEQPFRPEMEEFSTCISTNTSCSKEINYPEEEDLHGRIKEGIEVSIVAHQDHIEIWFQEVTIPQYHVFLQYILLQKQVIWSVLHIQVLTVTNFSYVDKCIFLILIRI